MPKHILSSEQFSTEELDDLFVRAESLRAEQATPVGRRRLAEHHRGAYLVSLFYEPSTRTRLSFEAAAIGLGVGVTGTENAHMFSSATKGETIEDTIKVLNEYNPDFIVLRHDETGAAARAAAVSDRASIINAGDGKGEHPTQALLDLYTIQRNHGRLDDLNIIIGGDLANGRTARSLAKLLAQYDNNSLTFVSVPELQMGDDIKSYLDENDTYYEETDDMYQAFRGADVVYWTRLQKERLAHPEAIPSGGFIIDEKALKVLPPTATIMHPLPRTEEISTVVDSDHRARYFEQAGNGLYVRMALIDTILKLQD